MKNTNVKFTVDNAAGGLRIPRAALAVAGLHPDKPMEYRALPGVMAVCKKQMTAVELANTAHSLQTLADEYLNALCDLCGKCEGCEQECPYETADFDMELELPEALLERAGIPGDAKLFATTVDGGVLICAQEQVPSLQSIPGAVMDVLLAGNACPGNLEQLIRKGDIVYGD